MRRLAMLVLVPLLGVGCGGDDDDAASAERFCARSAEVEDRFEALEDELSGDAGPTGPALERAADAVAELAEDAPDQIKDDMDTFVAGLREVADLFGELDLSDPAVLNDPENAQTLQDMGSRVEGLDEQMSEASANVERFLRDECGVDLDDGSSDAGGGGDGS